MSKKSNKPINEVLADITEKTGIPTEMDVDQPITKIKDEVVEVKVVEVTGPNARPGIGKFIVDKIMNQPELTNQQILDEVKAKFESAKTTMACVAWYKTKLRKEGKIGARVKAKAETAEA